MNRKCDPIAVFDSGMGGISVLRHLLRLMPGERFVYYGDSANAPYGTRSRQEVRALTFAALQPILAQGVKALVVACNTATAAAIDDLRQAYPEIIIVGIEPALKLAAERFPGGRIGVMATEVTLREEKFTALLAACRKTCQVTPLQVPGIVELVEAGKSQSPEMDDLLSAALTPYRGKLDAIVLGCTHYPFAARSISRAVGSEVALLDGGEGTARQTRRRLEQADLLEQGEGMLRIQNSRMDPQAIELAYHLLEQRSEG